MLHLEVLPEKFTVCKPEDPTDVRLDDFCFLAGTDRELSLVCPTALVPERTAAREDGLAGFPHRRYAGFCLDRDSGRDHVGAGRTGNRRICGVNL